MVSYRISRKSAGFTLIELLVVIAIIAILASILIPVLVGVRQKAKYVQCSNNTKELTLAILLYASDNGNLGVPLVGWGGDCINSDVRQSPIWKYLKSSVQNGDITCCPNDNFLVNGRRRKWSITMNGFLVGTWFWFACTGATDSDQGGMPYTIFAQPTRLPAWVCENTDVRLGETVNDTNFCNEDITSMRHQGYCTVSYLDGHSGRLKGRLKWNTAKWPDGVYIFRPTNAR